MIRRLLLFIMWFVVLPFLSLQAQSPGGVVRPAEGDSTTATNQAMRVVTFKAVPGTERTYYYHRDHRGMKNKGQIRLYSTSQYGLTIFWKEK